MVIVMDSSVISRESLMGVEAGKSFAVESREENKVALIAFAVFAGLAIASGVLAGMDYPLNLDGLNISIEGLEAFAAGSGALSLIIGGVALKNLHTIRDDKDNIETIADEPSEVVDERPGTVEDVTNILRN